jgi:hypothetical protein
MPALSTMTGFARNVGMSPELLLIDDLGVANFANLMTGEGWGSSGDLGDGVAPIVAVLSEALGNNRGTQDDEKEQRQQHNGGKSDEMFDVLEHGCLSGPE